MHYTPEQCLVNGGFPEFWAEKAMFQMGKMYLLRSPVPIKLIGCCFPVPFYSLGAWSENLLLPNGLAQPAAIFLRVTRPFLPGVSMTLKK